jgi:hypothetical protein
MRTKRTKRGNVQRAALVITALVGTTLAIGGSATAVVGGTWAIAGSNFEIKDGNTTVGVTTGGNPDSGDAAALDWNNVTSNIATDVTPRAADNAFGQGTKENTAVPTVVTGSIPPQKSDLKQFGTYVEAGRYLNVFWTRVQDPTGTTNMDFEFNANTCTHTTAGVASSGCSANGVTPTRSDNDLLITYDLANGGTHPTLGYRLWSSSTGAWGVFYALSDAAAAGGAINTSAITADFNGGSAPASATYSARTFGEASVDLNTIFSGNGCHTLGSAYLKSRSATSFGAEVKDFIAPVSVDLSNCGRIAVQKTDGTNPLDGAAFTVDPTSDIDPITHTTGSAVTDVPGVAGHVGLFCIDNLPLVSYRLTESQTPVGYTGAGYQTVTPTAGTCSTLTATPPVLTGLVTVSNSAAPGDINITKTDDAQNPVSGAGFTLYTDTGELNASNVPTYGTYESATDPATAGYTEVFTADAPVLQTDPAQGTASFAEVPLGYYCIVETTTPTGYATADPQCVHVVATDGGQTFGLAFVDPQLHKVIVIVCHEGQNGGLAPSDVTDGSPPNAAKVSIGASDLTGTSITESELCALDGASYSGLSHTPNLTLTVSPGSQAHN